MITWLRVLLTVVLLGIFGCAAQGTSVVLLADPDGNAGRITVQTQAGARVLDVPRQSTHVSNPSAKPSPPQILDQTQIDQTYARTLSALPQAPELFRLYFEIGTDALTAESRVEPQRIVAAIKRRKAVDVRISGHTDSLGQKEDNMNLSLKRAQTIADLLIGQGIDAASIRIFSHGDGLPLIPTPDQTPEPRNRRVEVVVR